MRTAELAWMLALVLAVGDQVQRAASGTESVPPARAIGVVEAIDAGPRHITIGTDTGLEVLVRYDEQAAFQRVAPGDEDLKKATAVAVSEIAAGDRDLNMNVGCPQAESGKSCVSGQGGVRQCGMSSEWQ